MMNHRLLGASTWMLPTQTSPGSLGNRVRGSEGKVADQNFEGGPWGVNPVRFFVAVLVDETAHWLVLTAGYPMPENVLVNESTPRFDI